MAHGFARPPASSSSTSDPAVASKTGNYTLTADDGVILADASGGGFTLTLPPAATVTDKQYTLKKTDSSANAVTIDPDGSETMDGLTTYPLSSQYETLTIVSDGASWHIL